MSNATADVSAFPPQADSPEGPQVGEARTFNDVPVQYRFDMEDADWANVPAKFQGAFVAVLTQLEDAYEAIRLLHFALYGKKSEKSKKRERQESGEPALPDDKPEADNTGDTTTPTSDDAGGSTDGREPEPPLPPPPGLGRKPLPAHLPRRRVVLDVPKADKLCLCCGEERPSFICENDATERYGFIPAQFFVWRFLRRKYGECPCHKHQDGPCGTQASTAPAGESQPVVGTPGEAGEGHPPLHDATDMCRHLLSPMAAPSEVDLSDAVASPAADSWNPASATPVQSAFSVAEPSCEPGLKGGQPHSHSQSHAPFDDVLPSEQNLPVVDREPVGIATLNHSDPTSAAAASTLQTLFAPLTVTVPSTHPSGGVTAAAVVVASPLPQLIRKGLPGHGLLAHIIVSKVSDGLPLYRQARQYLRSGVDIKRSTMSGWLIKVAMVLGPIMAALRREVLSARCIHIDETPFDVLAELTKRATAQVYMWVFAGGEPGRRSVEFRYDPSRSAEVPCTYLQGYKGDILTDGYAGYDFLLKWTEITLLACWVHVRRKFHDVIKALPAECRGKNTIAGEALARIRVLYRLEKYADKHHFTEEQRRELRQQRAKPVIDAMKTWLEELKPKVPPSSKLGEAIGYALNMWSRLEHYVNAGHRHLDNNWVENLIRPFAVGRKAWLFCATPEGAQAMATFHSLIATAIVNGIEPHTYLRALFDQFAVLLETSNPVTGPSPEQCRALLPQYIDKAVLDAEVPESRFTLAALIRAAEAAAAA